ncbi:MAG: hypothetical protein J6S67_12300, partial [Methanobrevibacter sp.]|nr:hypothetical protein [Methanobrevibacter sp.]
AFEYLLKRGTLSYTASTQSRYTISDIFNKAIVGKMVYFTMTLSLTETGSSTSTEVLTGLPKPYANIFGWAPPTNNNQQPAIGYYLDTNGKLYFRYGVTGVTYQIQMFYLTKD